MILRSDLRIDSYRAGFKTTLIRVTHMPSGIVIESPASVEQAIAEIAARLAPPPKPVGE